jgi:hypothetical protein
MAFALASTTITQSGTDTSLAGLNGIAGVTRIANGDGYIYYMPTLTLNITGTLTIADPAKETYTAAAVRVLSGGNYTSGTLCADGVTPKTGGVHFVVTGVINQYNRSVNTGSLEVQSGGQYKLIGGTYYVSGGVAYIAGATNIEEIGVSAVASKAFGTASTRIYYGTPNISKTDCKHYDLGIDMFQKPASGRPFLVKAFGAEYVTQYVGSPNGGSDSQFIAYSLSNQDGTSDFDNYDAGWVELYNCASGANLKVVCNANKTNHVVPLFQNINFKVTNLSGVVQQNARFRCIDAPVSNTPTATITTTGGLKTWDFRTPITYTGTTDANGVATSSPVLQVWHGSSNLKNLRFPASTATYRFCGYALKQQNVNIVLGSDTAIQQQVALTAVQYLTLTEAQAAALTGISISAANYPISLYGTTSATASDSSQTLTATTQRVRYVMLRKGADSLDLAEVEVMSGGTNVALNKSVTLGPQSFYPGYPGSMVVNGNTTDFYASNSASSNSWIQIDLGQEYVVSSIKLYPRSGSSARMTNVSVYCSAVDLTTWANSVSTYAGAGTALPTIIENAASGTVTVSAAVTAANLWHYYRQWIAQTANFDSTDTWDYDGATLNIGAWNLTVNAGVTLTGDLATTGTVTNNGTINGNYTDASGTRVTIKSTDNLALSTYLTVNGTPQAWQAGQTERYLFVTPASVVRLYAHAYGYQPTILNITGNTASDYIVKLTPETLVDTALSTTTRDAIVAHIAIGMDGSSRLFLSTDADLSAYSPDEVLNAIHYYMVTQGNLIAAASVTLNDVNTIKVIQGGIIVHSPGFYGKIADSVTTVGAMGIFAPIFVDVDPDVYVAMPTYSPVEKNSSGLVLQTARWTKLEADIPSWVAKQSALTVINEGVKKASLLIPHSESLP